MGTDQERRKSYFIAISKLDRKNSLEESRSQTDFVFITLLFTSLLTWFGAIFYVFIVPEEEHISSPSVGARRHLYKFAIHFSIFEDYLKSAIPSNPITSIFCFCIAIMCAVGLMKLLLLHPVGCTKSGIVTTVFLILNKVYNIYAEVTDKSVNSKDELSLFSMIVSISSYFIGIFYLIVAFCCITGPVKLSEVTVITKNIFSFLSSLVYPSLIVCLSGIVQGLIFYTSGKALMESLRNEMISIVIALNGLYLINFMTYYSKMVLSHMFASWRKTGYRRDELGYQTLRSMTTISRNHLGTVAFSATVVLPAFVAVIAAFNTTFATSRKCFGIFINILFIPYLVCYMADFTSVATAMHGQNSYQSTKMVIRTLTKNSILSFSFIFIFSCFLYLTVVLILCAIGIPFFFFYGTSNSNYMSLSLLLLPFIARILTFITTMFEPIAVTNLLCILENVKDNRNSEENSHPMTSNAFV